MKYDIKFDEAKGQIPHLKALGESCVYLHIEEPRWELLTDIDTGGGVRLGMPVSVYLIAEIDGIEFRWSLDFETRDANGTGTSQFDRPGLREAALRMPVPVRRKFGLILEKILPALVERRSELQGYLNKQADSEDCTRGLIAFCEEAS